MTVVGSEGSTFLVVGSCDLSSFIVEGSTDDLEHCKNQALVGCICKQFSHPLFEKTANTTGKRIPCHFEDEQESFSFLSSIKNYNCGFLSISISKIIEIRLSHLFFPILSISRICFLRNQPTKSCDICGHRRSSFRRGRVQGQ